METPQFGTRKTTKIINDSGTTVTTEKKYVSGQVSKPVRHYYEDPIRVYSQEEEQQVYAEFSNELKTDKGKLDPAFKIQSSTLGDTKGYYYVVKCYTKLEY